MVEDFSIQFSPLYLFMKYLAIISRHPVYCTNTVIHMTHGCPVQKMLILYPVYVY